MARRYVRFALGLAAALATCSCESLKKDPTPPAPKPPPIVSLCPDGPPLGEPGRRVLALVVGVSNYAAAEVPDLKGAAGDADALYHLLTGEDGFNIPTENVCLLVDQDATLAGVKEAFEKRLIEQASTGDEALFYFAGHGSSTYDLDRDETDGWDGTLALWDSRIGGVPDLLDDELATWIARLQARTPQVTLLLDACSSGTSTRGGTRARRLPPTRDAISNEEQQKPLVANGVKLLLQPGLLSLAAAEDGVNALEPADGGHGYFTKALLAALKKAASSPATWVSVFRETQAVVSKRSFQEQIPVLQGDSLRVALRPDQGGFAALGASSCKPMDWYEMANRKEGDELLLTLMDERTGATLPLCRDNLTVVRPGQRWTVQVQNRSDEAVSLRAEVLFHDPLVPDVSLPLSNLSPRLASHTTALLDRDAAFVAGSAGAHDVTLVVAGCTSKATPRQDGEEGNTSLFGRTMTVQVAEEPALSDCDQEDQENQQKRTLLTYPLEAQIQKLEKLPKDTMTEARIQLLQAVAATPIGAEDPILYAFKRAGLPSEGLAKSGCSCNPAQAGDVLVRRDASLAVLIDPDNDIVWTRTDLGARYLRLPRSEDPDQLKCTRPTALASGRGLEASACAP